MSESAFTCAGCGGMFVSDRSDEEALAEANALWTPEDLQITAIVCEDCFQLLYYGRQARRPRELQFRSRRVATRRPRDV